MEHFKNEIDKRSDRIRIIESYLALREFKNYINISFSYGDSIDRKSKTKKKHQTSVKTFKQAVPKLPIVKIFNKFCFSTNFF